MEGDYLSHDYCIKENGSIIAAIHKKRLSWADAFELDINGGKGEVMVLAVILAIDAVRMPNPAPIKNSSEGAYGFIGS